MVAEVFPAEKSPSPTNNAAAGPGTSAFRLSSRSWKAKACPRVCGTRVPADRVGTDQPGVRPGWPNCPDGAPEIAPEAINCAAPDTGNMEVLHMFGTPSRRSSGSSHCWPGRFAAPSMTEPAVASSDARNIQTGISRDGDHYVINGRKWWTSGANDPRCAVLIVMGRTNPDAASHQQQSMILVPMDTPGYQGSALHIGVRLADQHGHAEIIYDNVRVPASNILAEEGMASPSPRPAWVRADPPPHAGHRGSLNERWR